MRRLGTTALRRFRRSAAPPGHAGTTIDATPAGDRRIIDESLPFTMTGKLRLQALIDAVRYCVSRGVPGAFVECGVWRGGSALAMILTLREMGALDRDVYLFDTFEGMTEPGEHDVSSWSPPAAATWRAAKRELIKPWGELFDSETFNEESVREMLSSTGYPADRLKLVRGPVEKTVPDLGPERLALLRLDTDWYDSTRHELVHLYPRLTDGGVLIVDDYGHWDGARRAVDEYFDGEGVRLLLNRIDYTGRIAVKA